MEWVILSVVGLAFAFVALGLIWRRAPLVLEDEERAFDETIHVRPINHSQIDRLAPLVHSLHVLRVAAAMEGDREEPEGDDRYEIFVIDSLGAVHDVFKTNKLDDARFVAEALAAALNRELIDDAGVLR